jgi:F-type H+-transporting ATPase subunit alpha
VPMTLAQEVSIIYVATKGFLDDVPLERIRDFEKEFQRFLSEKYPDVINDLEKEKDLTDAMAKRLDQAVTQFKKTF